MKENIMNFKKYYITETEKISSIKLNLKTDLKSLQEIPYEVYKATKEYLKLLSGVEDTTIKEISIGDLKTSKILEPSFIMHKWDTLYEFISYEFMKGGKVYLFDVGPSKNNTEHYYYIANDKKFFNSYKINSTDILRVVKDKMAKDKENKAQKQTQTVSNKEVAPVVKEKELDNGHPIWGYFGIDRDDIDKIHDAILKNKYHKHIDDYYFQNKVGEGHKYKIEGSDNDTGIVYMIGFNDKALGGVLVFYKEVSFKIAHELGMFKGLEIGNDYPHESGRKRQLKSIDQLLWQEISPIQLTVDKDPVKEIEDIQKECDNTIGNILIECHNISVHNVNNYLDDFGN